MKASSLTKTKNRERGVVCAWIDFISFHEVNPCKHKPLLSIF
jgi:hypothetical protein